MRISLLFISIVLTLPAIADWNKLNPSDYSIKAPPTEGSAAYKKDFTILLQEQDSRTEEDCSLAGTQKAPTFRAFYGTSTILSKKELSSVETFVSKTMKAGEGVANFYKAKYTRPRPYDEDSHIQPCVEKPGGAKSYPSSHALMAALSACVLSEIFPDRAEALTTYGTYLGDLRVKVGVHHPSDVVAGQKLAKDICTHLMEEPDFVDELNSNKP